jgi:HSP20 family protein
MTDLVKRSPFLGNIARSDPFFNLDDWFNNFWMPRRFSTDMEAISPIKVDITENDKAYTIRAEIPGVKKEDVKVQVDGNLVSISAETKQKKEKKEGGRVVCSECSQGSSYRSFTLDSNVNEAKSQAKFEDGMLELILPKKNGAGAKQLKIK